MNEQRYYNEIRSLIRELERRAGGDEVKLTMLQSAISRLEYIKNSLTDLHALLSEINEVARKGE